MRRAVTLGAVVALLTAAPASAHSRGYWISKQIHAATKIGRSSHADPWPHCPDPIWDGARSWWATVRCENSGNWYDSPGYFRCGLQFDPKWEKIYGRLCP